MTDIHEWELQLQHDLDEIRRISQQLTKAAASIRGRGETRGVAVEINASGDITDLQIAPAAMRWSSSQLSQAIVECHRQARAEVKAETERLLRTTDPRIRDHILQARDTSAGPEHKTRPRTEEEIQAADDAYFERMNRGWRTDR
ncbi:YbaB/EbfC family nucleoid-associated protein [Nocardia pseudobrasiliensis]|uniref:YbaB/EbfC DNA-binding family protein n=1 Tax=Nocardia pseudobrasiliensis TaxID=45979 RepID=A0A370HQ60_9NOCA|nr:YbaB/EbfC family nucleoid-associated protein [Nocardia pseudobrasiliensis]RDI59034.1 YbaB/EbfC DNA-binding family protein [Nocardia pseudobrasiliensis]